MNTPEKIYELIETFDRNISTYKTSNYNETQVRREFIDPFFTELGWDVSNTQGYAEAYKDVIHEYSIKTGDSVEAPDYCFRIGGTRKFFVEAKKPKIDIKDSIHPAYQLRRYAWSAKLPLSILTDFEELVVYDCRIPPQKNDKASTGRIKIYNYKDYISAWDEISGVFSKDAILKGSFDKYAETNKGKKGTAEVDDLFLKEIEGWRDVLAKNIALRNPAISVRELNYSVQKIIDRIIFLRICEDRGIEEYGELMTLLNGVQTYPRLCQVFKRADEKYNSGLFHFEEEKNRYEHPDELTLDLLIDDKVLKDVIKNLYYPDCPYEFSVLPADILGHVYEQFLGKIIRLTDGHRAIVEDKPEVKKAGGVYYTPTYIVDYIVKNTLGVTLDNAVSTIGDSGTKQKKILSYVSSLKILDPACGSGSFLLGAYQYLLDWHLKYYVSLMQSDAANKKTIPVYQSGNGEWRLTTAEKKRILLNNIYGVDIDQQAVEVTKLSLLLKVLEGESEESITNQYKFFKERALPDLGSNIKCGNSIIGPDFYDEMEFNFLDDEEKLRINVFDWKKEFKEIMENGGFDVVVGNPPYVRIQALKEWAPNEVEHYRRKYKSASKGNYDIYIVFIEKGLELLNTKGIVGFILPNKFFNSQYGILIRKILSENKNVSNIVHFGSNQIFKGATTYTSLLFLNKSETLEFGYIKVDNLENWKINPSNEYEKFNFDKLSPNEWNLISGEDSILFKRIDENNQKLDNFVDIFVGVQTSADSVFILKKIHENSDKLTLFSVSLNREVVVEKDLFHPLVSGTDVKGFTALSLRQYILYPYEIENEQAKLIVFDKIKSNYPLTAEYLLQNKKQLEDREKGSFRDKNWYRFGRNQNLGIQGRCKVCVPRLVEKLHAGLDPKGNFYLDNVDVGGLTFNKSNAYYDLNYLCALLNSKLLKWFFKFVAAPFRGGWFSANKQFLKQLPFKSINMSGGNEKKHYEEINRLVDEIMILNMKWHLNKIQHEKNIIQRQIEITNNKIDKHIYELYSLTEEEIEIVEGK